MGIFWRGVGGVNARNMYVVYWTLTSDWVDGKNSRVGGFGFFQCSSVSEPNGEFSGLPYWISGGC